MTFSDLTKFNEPFKAALIIDGQLFYLSLCNRSTNYFFACCFKATSAFSMSE